MRNPRLARQLIAPLSLLLAGTAVPAWAQSLQELYDAARTYDAAYLSAKAAAQAAEYRAAQADALLRPSAALSGSASMGLGDAPRVGTRDTNALGATLSGKYPLINKGTAPAIEQSRKAVLQPLNRPERRASRPDPFVQICLRSGPICVQESVCAIMRDQDRLNRHRAEPFGILGHRGHLTCVQRHKFGQVVGQPRPV